jgi:hypothetical protein
MKDVVELAETFSEKWLINSITRRQKRQVILSKWERHRLDAILRREPLYKNDPPGSLAGVALSQIL